MPAEAVHVSALHDAAVPPPRADAAKLGALFVDLPYFDRFPLAVGRYLFKRPPAPSRWGDVTHHRAPIAVARALMEEARRADAAARGWLHSFALGYICHAAVDRSVHPHVNAFAKARAEAQGDTLSRQHQEVEKYQSILFHEQRLGRDFMGTLALRDYCAVDASPLWKSPDVRDAVQRALNRAWGEAPLPADFRDWAGGYAQYLLLIASPLGKTVAPPAAKERVRAELFDGPAFPKQFEAAVAQSNRWMAALGAYFDDGRFDDSAKAQLEAEIPEGTIDPT